MKTVAGSQDAEVAIELHATSRRLAHGFRVVGSPAVEEPMRDINYVQGTFSRIGLGWTTTQA
jgi:hypothetical protein